MSRYYVSDIKYLKKQAPRMYETLVLLSEGYSYKEIAQKMFVTIHTVKNHVYILYERFGARNVAHLIHIAHQSGVLDG